MTTSTGWGAVSKAGDRKRRMAMTQSWKPRLVRGIALAAAIALGSTMATTSVRADSGWSWEGAIVGGVIGGLIGPTIDREHDRVGVVSFSTTLGTFHDGLFIVHRHHGGWHRHPWHHQREWHVWRGHQRTWYVHPPRYQHRQWHGQRVHQQPRHVHPPQHRHRHVHSQQVHQPPRHAHTQRRHHGHNHNW